MLTVFPAWTMTELVRSVPLGANIAMVLGVPELAKGETPTDATLVFMVVEFADVPPGGLTRK
jgi:hypothetical protein